MGCPQFEYDKRFDFLQPPSGKRMLKRHEATESKLQQWRDAQKWMMCG
jgi:hypothetical protein